MQNLQKANKRQLLSEVFNKKQQLNNKKIVTL